MVRGRTQIVIVLCDFIERPKLASLATAHPPPKHPSPNLIPAQP